MDKPESQPVAPASESLSERKLRMEGEKLQAEIEAIRRPLYRTPSFYTAMSPVLLAALGVIFTWASGWFDTQRKNIEADKKLLTLETKELESRKHEQQAFIDQLKSDRSVLTNQIAGLNQDADDLRFLLARFQQEKANLTNQISRLEAERNEIRTAKEFFENEAKRLAGSETNALSYLTQLKELQAEREQVQKALGRKAIIDGAREMDMWTALLANLNATREFVQIKNPSASQRTTFLMNVDYRANKDYYGKSYDHWLPDEFESATNVPPSWQPLLSGRGNSDRILDTELSKTVEDEKADEARLKSFQQYIEEAKARQNINK